MSRQDTRPTGALPAATLTGRLYALRDRLLGDERFQRIAARSLITRGIARKNAKKAFDLCAGFVYSQVVAACVELRVFDLLAGHALTLDEIAAATGLHRARADCLIRAAIALELVSPRSHNRFGLATMGAAIAGNAGLKAMITHHRMLYDDLRDPVALLKGELGTGKLKSYWAYADRDRCALSEPDVAAYSRLMSQSQAMLAHEIIDAYAFARHRTMLDLGGGDGTFITTVAAACPNLKFQHMDLPPVIALAQARLAKSGISPRVSCHPGSFLSDPLPSGADLVTLIRIVHDHDDTSVEKIFSAARTALTHPGVLLIGEPLSGTAGAESMGDAYFGFYLMAMGQGRPRTKEELTGLLLRAGFASVREFPTRIPLLTRVIAAQT
jgi:demethylspheroidene O-methyltransferase